MNKIIITFGLVVFVVGCSSFDEDKLHQLLDEADEVVTECEIYKRELACNTAINRVSRLKDFMDADEDAVIEHFKAHPTDKKLLFKIQKSLAKISG